MFKGRGASVKTNATTLVNNGTEIQLTQSAGGTVLEFVSPRVPAGGFTMSGTLTFNMWAQEAATNNNAGIRARVFRRQSNGTETENGSSPFNFGAPTELGTSLAARNWTGTPTSQAFSEDDRIVVRFYAINVGSMGNGTETVTYNGASAAASGDSYFQINETVAFKTETITKTIKTSGGDYSLLSTWESAQQSDIVTDDVISQAECYAGAYTDALAINGWTTGASNYIRIYTPTNQRHNGTSRDVSGIGFQVSNSTAASVIANSEAYVRLEGLDFKQAASGQGVITHAAGAAGGDVRVDSCVSVSAAASDAVYHFNDNNVDISAILRNNVMYGSCRGIRVSGLTNGTAELSHNTVHVTGTGTIGITYNGKATVKNNWVSGASTECFNLSSGSPTGSNNASSDASADDEFPTGALINKTAANQFNNLTGGSENFHIITGADLINAGTPLGAVTTDIVGNSRSGSTPTIGAFEFIITPKSASDTPSAGVTDAINALLAAFSRSDNPSLSISEVSGLATLIAASDAPAVAMTDAVNAILGILARADNPSAAISESKTLAASLSRTDNPSVAISDARTILALLSRADNPTVTLNEAKTVLAALARADNPSAAIGDALNALLVILARADNPSAAISEVSDVQDVGGGGVTINKLASDSPTIAVSDVVQAILAILSRTDNPTVTLGEAGAIAAALARGDSPAAAVADASRTISVTLSRIDSALVSLGEARAIFAMLDRTDATALSLLEAVSILVPKYATDTLDISIDDLLDTLGKFKDLTRRLKWQGSTRNRRLTWDGKRR